MSTPVSPANLRDFFDDYVRRDFPARRTPDDRAWTWPGDEWVGDAVRENTFRALLQPPPGETWREVIEIGPGSGKYTEMLLARTPAQVRAYEISPAFLDTLTARCEVAAAAGRLSGRLLDFPRNDSLALDAQDISGRVDLYFGVDVFLMMDFQAAFAHLLTAARLLRPGGRFAGTFGDGESESGWARMVRDAGRHRAFPGGVDTRFHWVARGALEQTLQRLGFQVVRMLSGPDGESLGELDIARWYVVAELIDPTPAARIWDRLFPAQPSSA